MTEYIEVEYNGEMVREYPDGALRHANGHFVVQHPLAAETIDRERSLELNERRWDMERENQRQEQEETQRAYQRALVSRVAGAKTLPEATEKLAGHLVAELDAPTAPKEHGIRNYSAALEWVNKRAGLIKEKETGTVNVDKLALIVTPGTREHVEGLLQKLAAASGSVSDVDTVSE